MALQNYSREEHIPGNEDDINIPGTAIYQRLQELAEQGVSVESGRMIPPWWIAGGMWVIVWIVLYH